MRFGMVIPGMALTAGLCMSPLLPATAANAATVKPTVKAAYVDMMNECVGNVMWYRGIILNEESVPVTIEVKIAAGGVTLANPLRVLGIPVDGMRLGLAPKAHAVAKSPFKGRYDVTVQFWQVMGNGSKILIRTQQFNAGACQPDRPDPRHERRLPAPPRRMLPYAA